MVDNPSLYAPGRDLLVARGYVREGKAQAYVREVVPGVTGRVWLNAGKTTRSLDLNPIVGVRYDQLTQRVLELTGLPGPLPMTHWQNLYALHPTKMASGWSIVVKGDDQRNAVFWDWMAQQLDEYGEPWLATYADPEQMKRAMRSLEAGGFSRVTLPVLLWLEGDPDGAREALQWGRSLNVNSAPVLDYDDFADRLLTEIETGPHGPSETP